MSKTNNTEPYWPPFEGYQEQVFLDTMINPKSEMIYDFWVIRTPEGWSWTCKHGPEESDYGSGPMSILKEPIQLSEKDIHKDYLFGIYHAQKAALEYFSKMDTITHYDLC